MCDIPAIDLHGHQSAVVSNGYPNAESLATPCHQAFSGCRCFGARARKKQRAKNIPIFELAAATVCWTLYCWRAPESFGAMLTGSFLQAGLERPFRSC